MTRMYELFVKFRNNNPGADFGHASYALLRLQLLWRKVLHKGSYDGHAFLVKQVVPQCKGS